MKKALWNGGFKHDEGVMKGKVYVWGKQIMKGRVIWGIMKRGFMKGDGIMKVSVYAWRYYDMEG